MNFAKPTGLFSSSICGRVLTLCASVLMAFSAPAQAAEKSRHPAGAPSANVVGVVDGADPAIPLGSGVLFTGGKVLTDCHILEDAERIEVLQLTRRSEAILTYADRKRDLCELKVAHPERFSPADLSLRTVGEIAAGEPVSAVAAWDGAARVTKGRVVKVETRNGDTIVLISSRLVHGYSGGALFDRSGALVGIVTHRERSTHLLSYAYPAQYALVRKASEPDPVAERTDAVAPPRTETVDFKTAADQYLGRLAEASRANLRYPDEAREQGWAGTTSIRFDIDAGGGLRQSFVDASSGYAGLDVAALLAVRKALEQLEIPKAVKEKGLKGTVSITFTAPSGE
jgi:TonB family protein